MRELDFTIIQADLKNAYGTFIQSYENTNILPVNTCRDYYDSNLGVLYIHNGSGRLPLALAQQPLMYLKQALLHECFINELDKALLGEKYNARLFKNAVDEFQLINDFEPHINNASFSETISKLIAKIGA